MIPQEVKDNHDGTIYVFSHLGGGGLGGGGLGGGGGFGGGGLPLSTSKVI